MANQDRNTLLRKVDKSSLVDIIDFSADAILALDSNYKIVMFNAAAQNLFGYSAEEIHQQPIDILLPKDVRPKHDNYIRSFNDTVERARFMSDRSSVKGLTKDGQLIPLDISIQKHLGDREIRYSAVCRDISAFQTIIKDLETSEARLSRAQKIAQVGNWEWDIATGEVAWSDEIYRIFERERHNFDSTYENFLETIHEADRAKVEESVLECVNKTAPYSIIHRIVCPDGSEKTVQEKGEVVCNANGDPIRMDGTVQDITIAWKKEDQLRQTTQQASAANMAKSQFLATMSHELRTPLNAIIGLSAMMQDSIFGEITPSKYKEYIIDINNSGENLLTHINNILDVSNIELQSINTVPLEIKSKDLINTCLQMTKHLSVLNEIKFDISIDPELDFITTDPTHARKILVNLISNAVKFSHKKGLVKISLSTNVDTEKLIFTVEDFGIGISQENLEAIFEPFTQTDMEFTRKYDGAGLGLSIAKALVETQDGTITVESELNMGTKVTITLPLIGQEGDDLWL